MMPQTTPIGLSFATGEKLNVHISGHNPFEYPPTDNIGPPAPKVPIMNDAVKVMLHGGQADGSGSYIVFPVMGLKKRFLFELESSGLIRMTVSSCSPCNFFDWFNIVQYCDILTPSFIYLI